VSELKLVGRVLVQRSPTLYFLKGTQNKSVHIQLYNNLHAVAVVRQYVPTEIVSSLYVLIFTAPVSDVSDNQSQRIRVCNKSPRLVLYSSRQKGKEMEHPYS
jgi:hypothetical protein